MAETDPLLVGSDEDTVDVQSHEKQTVEYEDALEKIGIGRYQTMLLMLCGWANAADAVEMLGISFVITTTAECDFDMDEARKGWVTSVLFLGMMVGGWLWGNLADSRGRKWMLIIALLVNFAASAGSAFAPNYAVFLALRFLSGLGVGGSIPIVFTYFCEFLPAQNRGAFLNLVAAFWMVGTIIVAGLAWGILGSTECKRAEEDTSREAACGYWLSQDCGTYRMFGTTIPAWRIFVLSCSLPALVAALGFFKAPESPKWLLSQGRTKEAEAVLNLLARVNARMATSVRPDFVELSLKPTQLNTAHKVTIKRKTALCTKILRGVALVFRDTASLFKPSTLKPTLVLSGVWITLSFGFYGLTLWLPNYYQHGGIDDTVSVYKVSFFVACSNLPGNIFAYWSLDRLGRRITLIVSMMASAASVFSILEINSTAGTTIFSCVFAAVSVAGWNALSILSAELFPTSHRGAAFGLMTALGRIGAILGNTAFGQMSASNPQLPLFCAGGALAIGAMLCLMLAETRGAIIS
eukprot:TRINITY_DN10985_c0_g4_i2.p1 TRINITY_DN10985_c0_g4~~TRINITY_DN10985_c0_g4_i2.p1  ORF type:complete len:579 (+),score=80.45 TRINITY_DN10985_c0_g4_i2:171-1739(+)